MELLLQGVSDAVRLILACDRDVADAAWRSLWISTLAVLLATLVGLPLATLLARTRFPGRRSIILALRAAMAFPTVFLGMVVYSLLARRGPLGPLELLYTPWAIVFGEFLLALPLVAAISHGALETLDYRVFETAKTLGAHPIRRVLTYYSETQIGIMLAVLTAFSRCVTELGIAMMVGGNIKTQTRTLATATALETSKGEFARGMAMGMILLLMAVGVTFAIGFVGRNSDGPNAEPVG